MSHPERATAIVDWNAAPPRCIFPSMKNIWKWLGGAVAIVGGVFYAAGIRVHQDPGLQKVCFDSVGHAHYKVEPNCKVLKELRWTKNQFPLSVTTSNRGEPTRDANVAEAISNVNSQMGFKAFTLWGPDADKDATVNVTLDVPAERNWTDAGGQVRHARANGVMRATVQVTNIGDIATLHRVLVHEFGHVLGLAHDDFEDSAMWPTISGDRLGARFTDGDCSAIRKLYKR